MAVTNISKSQISDKDSGKDIPYMLQMSPSVVATSETGTGIGYTSLRVRGTDPSRINVTIDGIPLNDSESHGVYWVNMPDFTSSIDNVQIQRGVGTSSNGSASFGATVNFATSAYSENPYATVSSSVGSYDTYKNTVSVGTGLINDKFAMDVRISKLDSEGYVDRGFSDHKSAKISATYLGDDYQIKASAMFGDQKTGITWWGNPDVEANRTYNPAGEYTDENDVIKYYDGQTDNYKQNHYQFTFTKRENNNFNYNVSLHYTGGKGYYEQYKEDEDISEYGNFASITTDLIRQKWLDNDFFGAVVSANYSLDKLDVSFGASANRYLGNHFGEIKWIDKDNQVPDDYQWYHNFGRKEEISSFLKFNYQATEDINLFLDAQVRKINYNISGIDDDLKSVKQKQNYGFFNPKLGLSCKVNDNFSTYASVAIANREPARADLKEALKEGGTVKPTSEKLIDYELGAKYSNDIMSFEINLYYMDYTDQLVNTGKKSSVGYDLMENVKDSYRAGIELVLGVKLGEYITWEANATLSENKIKNHTEYYYGTPVNYTDNDISYSPSFIGASVFTTKVDNLTISATTKYVGEQYFTNANVKEAKLDSYLVNNLNASYKIEINKYIKSIVLQGSANNIFSVEYSNNAYGGHWINSGNEKDGYDLGTWSYYYPQAPINFMFKASINF